MEKRRRPIPLLRPIMIVIALAVMWYGSSKLLQFFDRSVDLKTATSLEARTKDGVQVSIQGQEWQAGETGLRLYAGDAVSTKSTGDAVLRFFDGTRIRLDTNTDVEIVRADRQAEGTSILTLKIRAGRIWMATPDKAVFTGAIVRTAATENYNAEVPHSSNVLIAGALLNVVKASGLGVKTTLVANNAVPLYIGEGQYFSLDGNAKSAIETGSDPYEFRDPITAKLLQDEFLTSSYALLLSDNKVPITGSGTTAPADDTEPLVVTTPLNNESVTEKSVTVSGRVSTRVSDLLINGQSISVLKDQAFSAEISLSKDPTSLITIEAKNAQGITLAKIERTVINSYKIVVEPPRIKSPVGSGQTLTTKESVIEITGEAPPNTAAIFVNDYRLQLFQAGGKTWSYLANAKYGNLVEGENIFSVTALDKDGNRSAPRSITIIYEPVGGSLGSGTTISSSSEPPIKQNPPLKAGTLLVLTPSQGTSSETTDNELSITGTTDAETYSISVNGYTLSLYEPGSTAWKYIASTNLETMKRGKNVYRVVSRNNKGEILDVLEYTLTYRP